MKYIIVIEDAKNGIDIRADLLKTLNEAENNPEKSMVEELGKFLTHAAEVWVKTQHMDMPKTQAFIQSITTKPTIQ